MSSALEGAVSVESIVGSGQIQVLAIANHSMVHALLALELQQFLNGGGQGLRPGPHGAESDAAGFVDQERGIRQPGIFPMDAAVDVIYQHRHPQIFFITKNSGGVGLLAYGAVGRQSLPRVSFTSVDEKKFNIATAKLVIQPVQSRDRGRSGRTGGRTKD